MKKLRLFIIVMGLFLLHGPCLPLLAQRIISDALFEVREEKLLSDRIVVRFREQVVNLTKEESFTSLTGLKDNYSDLKSCFDQFCKYQGISLDQVYIGRAIKRAEPGEKFVRNRATGEWINIGDWSLLMTVKFPQLVPIELLIEKLNTLDLVEYAHQPISILLEDDPPVNDIDYSYQWYLENIKAPQAWQITHGSSSKKIAIIESDGVKTDHEDLQAKILTPGTEYKSTEPHGTQVAGIAAAHTDNLTGIAGLAWEPKLLTYDCTYADDPYISAIPDMIYDAIDDIADVINCSFITIKKVKIGDKYWWDTCTYISVDDAICSALNNDIVVVACAGNDPPNYALYSIPYDAYPAAYSGVIGVSATKHSDEFVDVWNYNKTDPPNFLVDVAAPGWEIYSTSFSGSNDTYTYSSGTSCSAPQVAALAALIRSIETFTNAEVESIITSSADTVGQYTYGADGYNDYLGYGRINAYQALLLALAYDTKSHSSLATAYNNGRRLIHDGDNRYHLVFESGGEIFYCRSIVGGSSWETPVRISTGNESNKYPSITGTSSKQFVVWQRYNQETSNYDTYFTKNTGSGWTSAATITNLSNLISTTDPLPVVTYKTRSGGYRLLVGAKNSSAIRYVTSDNDGSAWSSAGNLPSTGSSHKNPSLSMGPTTPSGTVYVAYDNGSNIYYNTYTTSWGSAHNVSSGCGTSSNRYPSVEVDGWSGRNFAWQGFSNPLLCWVIVHRRNNGAFQIFSNKGDGGNRASITGHVNNKRSIVFTADGANEIYRAKYNGSNWSVDFIASNGQHPNISAGTTTAKYVWTSGSSSPYEIKLSSEFLSKSSGVINLVYHRAAVLQDTINSSILWTELGEMMLITDRGEIPVQFKPVDDGDLELTQNSVFTYLESEPFVIAADVTGIICYRNVYGKGLQQLSAKGVESVSIKLQLVDVQTGKTLQQLQEESLAVAEQESRVQGTVTKEITGYYGKKVVIRVVAAGLAAEVTGVVPGVVEVFITDQEGTTKQQPQRPKREVVQAPAEFALLQSYPNPFNPEMSIPYTLPQQSHVLIEVYNVLGQKVATLVDEYKPAGYHTSRWDGRDSSGKKAPAGIYLCCMKAGGFVKTQKMTLLP